jgi:Fe-S cluster assembly protein SufD
VELCSAAEITGKEPELAQRLLDQTDIAGGQAFASLNAALFADGFVLALDAGVALDKPVEIIHWGDAAESSLHLRNLIQLGAGSRATIVESYAGRGRYWTNAVTRVELGAGAALRQVKVQDEASDAIHFGQVRANIAADARYESFVLTLGGRLSRHDSFATFAGEGAACGLFGAYLLKGEQESTNATFVDHAVPKCATSEVFKGVVDERAHGVFLGKIGVRPQAQKTDAHQLNKNLLLSPRANVDTKPELEILADDVKCSHGATVGDLDENALFYLAARGIPADEARRMLIEAFAADAIDQIEDDTAMRAHLLKHVQRWLGRKD